MEPYTYIEHTADAEFFARGKSIEEAFSNAAYALMRIIVDYEQVKPARTRSIRVEGKDQKALLYNFLEEFIFLLDAEDFLMHRVDKIMINELDEGWQLDAIVSGDEAVNYQTEKAVKAATYNSMEITHEKGIFTLHVVVDI